jgi:hypothetical protein
MIARKGNFSDTDSCSRLKELEDGTGRTMNPYQTRAKSIHEWAVPTSFHQQRTWSAV